MPFYALVVGTGNYLPEANVANLPFALNDARAIARLLRDRRVRIEDSPDLNVTLVLDGHDWLIERKLEELFNNKHKDDLLIVYFSCHAWKNDYGDLYLLAPNSRLLSSDTGEKHYSTGSTITIETIKTLMDRCRSRRQVLILDSCFSGAFGKHVLSKASADSALFDQLGGEGRHVITATSSTQVAFPDNSQRFSLFTGFLIEGIRTGRADSDHDGLFSTRELFEYAREKVSEHSDGKQTPRIWMLESAGEIYVARNRKTTNPIIADIKLNPEKHLELLSSWALVEVQFPDGTLPSGELITTSITSRNQIKKCYSPSPLIEEVKQEVLNERSTNVWLFVSPEGTGRTSMLTYLSLALLRENPRRKIVEIQRLPSDPQAKELFQAISLYVDLPKHDPVFILNGKRLDYTDTAVPSLLVQLSKSRRRSIVLGTCTPEEYDAVEKSGLGLVNHINVRFVPGYIDENPAFYHKFIEEKFQHLPTEHRQALLDRSDVTMNSLCAIYAASVALPEALGSHSLTNAESLFYSMPRKAQFLAHTIKYIGAIPQSILRLMVAHTTLFSNEDYETVRDTAFTEEKEQSFGPSSLVIKPTAQMDQFHSEDFLDYEKSLVIDSLLQLVIEPEDIITAASLVQTLSLRLSDMNTSQSRAYRQLVRRAQGAKFCSNCRAYSAPDDMWCPTCGRSLDPRDKLSHNEKADYLEKYLTPIVPFPKTGFSEDVDRPAFAWKKMDFSAFD